ncbi:MAG: hypothetical protein H6810_06000 [Phycisphaeraceae bacterium]|nr:MAG: hypothetical protein H6810_06000 [Phycisphaeraceae bacterium]
MSRPVLIMLVTGVIAIGTCIVPGVWLMGRVVADSRKIVPGVILKQINGTEFWLESDEWDRRFEGRHAESEVIDGIAVVRGAVPVAYFRLRGDDGVAYAVWPNFDRLPTDIPGVNVGPGYIGDRAAFEAYLAKAWPHPDDDLVFDPPIEWLRANHDW